MSTPYFRVRASRYLNTDKHGDKQVSLHGEEKGKDMVRETLLQETSYVDYRSNIPQSRRGDGTRSQRKAWRLVTISWTASAHLSTCDAACAATSIPKDGESLEIEY